MQQKGHELSSRLSLPPIVQCIFLRFPAFPCISLNFLWTLPSQICKKKALWLVLVVIWANHSPLFQFSVSQVQISPGAPYTPTPVGETASPRTLRKLHRLNCGAHAKRWRRTFGRFRTILQWAQTYAADVGLSDSASRNKTTKAMCLSLICMSSTEHMAHYMSTWLIFPGRKSVITKQRQDCKFGATCFEVSTILQWGRNWTATGPMSFTSFMLNLAIDDSVTWETRSSAQGKYSAKSLAGRKCCQFFLVLLVFSGRGGTSRGRGVRRGAGDISSTLPYIALPHGASPWRDFAQWEARKLGLSATHKQDQSLSVLSRHLYFLYEDRE